MKRLNVLVTVAVVTVLGTTPTARGDVLTPVPGCPAEYQDASVTVQIATDKYTYWGWDYQTGQEVRITVNEWYATFKFSGLEPMTDYWLSGTTTDGQILWLCGFMSDTGSYPKTNGGLHYGTPPKFAYFELWSDSTPDPYYLGEPVEVLLSSQR